MKLILLLFTILPICLGLYEPDWNSLDSRELPQWYDDAKIGIMIHWGVSTVPNFGDEWFWWHWKEDWNPDYINYMRKNYKPDFSYQEFAPELTGELFDANQWVDLIEKMNAKYVVLTSKHHEGYTLWPSPYAPGWNTVDVGPKRDIINDLARALRSRTNDIKFGLYYSLYEWFHPLYLQDKSKRTNNFVQNKIMPELKELITKYKPEVLWSDGDWEQTEDYWQSKEFLAWLFNESPVNETVVVNDRWGLVNWCKHGSFRNCWDRYNPRTKLDFKWENVMSIDKESWGWREGANLSSYFSAYELISEIVTTVSCGGNILINVSPTKAGNIPVIFEERISYISAFLSVNNEAIFSTRPWRYQNESDVIWYTASKDQRTVYAIHLDYPKDGKIVLKHLHGQTTLLSRVSLLGYPFSLRVSYKV